MKLLIHNNKNVSYSEIDSSGGHDAFLMENEDYFEIMRNISGDNNGFRNDLELISSWIKPNVKFWI